MAIGISLDEQDFSSSYIPLTLPEYLFQPEPCVLGPGEEVASRCGRKLKDLKDLEVRSTSQGWKVDQEDWLLSLYSNYSIGFFSTIDLEDFEEDDFDLFAHERVPSSLYEEILAEIEPGFLCAEYCFSRVSRPLRRRIMKRTSLPLGDLEAIEMALRQEIVLKTASFVMQIDNAFVRLLLHALCAYYGLRSYSLSGEDGQRSTIIKLPRNFDGRLPIVPFYRFINRNLPR